MSSKVLGTALMVGGGILLAALIAKTTDNGAEPHFSEKPTTEAIGTAATTMPLAEMSEEQKIAAAQQKNREAQIKADQARTEALMEEKEKADKQALVIAKEESKVFDKPLEVQTRPAETTAVPATKPATPVQTAKTEPKKAETKSEPAKLDNKSSHTIVRGDSLSKLAKRYGVSVESLAAYNNMGKDDNLALGRVIKIPSENFKASEVKKPTPKPEVKAEKRPEPKPEQKVEKTEPRPSTPKVGDHHTVQSGDTLGHLARQYGVSVDDIARLNGMSNADSLAAGAVIKIPAGGKRQASTAPQRVEVKTESKPTIKAETRPAPKPATTGNSHTVQSGDTLGHLARQYGVSVEEIARANGMSNADSLAAGAVIKLPSGAKRNDTKPATKTETKADKPKTDSKPTQKTSSGNHTVQSGDTLGHLARQYGVSVDDIAKANGMGKDDNLPAGKTLKIPAKKSQ